jgi:hypothetical protein
MSFRHVVLLTFKDGTTDAERDAVVAALRTLPPVISSLRSYVVGVDAGMSEGNASIAVVADFDDVDGFIQYRDDPEHQRIIAELIRPILAARAAVQHRVDR